MRTSILWTGREYYSLENCLIIEDEHGTQIDSTIIGLYEGAIYRVHYAIQANLLWEVKSAKLDIQVNGRTNTRCFEEFGDCTEVDIPLTPFTNTLPIRRLKMEVGQTEFITVLYLDILANEFKPVRQKYHRISEFEYKYENVPNDFEAVITVDSNGFVVDYPGLFTRTLRKDL